MRDSFIDKINDFRLLAAAILDKNPGKVIVSRAILRDLRLKESFAAAARYPEDMARAQFIYYGDTSHADHRLHEFFYSDINLDRLAEAGFKHIFPELQPVHQAKVNAAAEGRLHPEEFAELRFQDELKSASAGKKARLLLEDPDDKAIRLLKAGRACSGFRRAHERGMKIHCLDDRKNLNAMDVEGLLGMRAMTEKYVYQTYGGETPIHGKLVQQAMIKNRKEAAYHSSGTDGSKIEALLRARAADDFALAQSMMAAAGEEKGAILFGAGHAKGKDGLFDTLGQDRTLRVDLYSSRDFCADVMFAKNYGGGIQPHYLHILDEDRFLLARKFG